MNLPTGTLGYAFPGKLESALGAVASFVQYNPGADVFEVAGRYAFYLALGHCWVDGNKRTALLTLLVFLASNGYDIRMSGAPEIHRHIERMVRCKSKKGRVKNLDKIISMLRSGVRKS